MIGWIPTIYQLTQQKVHKDNLLQYHWVSF
jgi:hypothetical protein